MDRIAQLSEIVAATACGPRQSFVALDLPPCVSAGDVDAARDVDRVPVAEAGAIITRDTIADAMEQARQRVPANVLDAATMAAGYVVSALAARTVAALVEAYADPGARGAMMRAALDATARTWAGLEPDAAAGIARRSRDAVAQNPDAMGGHPLACNLASGSAVMVALVTMPGTREPSPLLVAAHVATAALLDRMAADRADAERGDQ